MKNIKVTGQLRNYLQWPLVLIILWAAAVGILYWQAGPRAAAIGFVFMLIYAAVTVALYARSAPGLMNDMIAFATQYGQVQKKLLQEFTLPYGLLDEEGNVLWMNDALAALTGKDRHFSRSITDLFSEVEQSHLPGGENPSTTEIEKDGRIYRAEMKRVYADELLSDDEDLQVVSDGGYLIAFCLFDETELAGLKAERDENQFVCGQLSIDNYDEALEGVEDVRKSLLLALVERKINKYFSDVDGILRKLSHEKYFFVMNRKSLAKCEENHFSILDDVKTVNIGNEMALTLSIGIGYGAETFLENADSSRQALELALGRGGDQAVVEDGYRTRFFGGKSESTEKMTRVKARVKAHALQEIIEGKSQLVIMGHKIADIDAIGAALGIYRAARTMGKPAHILGDDVDISVKGVIEDFRKDPAYEDDLFIDAETAKRITGPDTVVVVVDTNKTGYTGCKELLTLTNSIVVLDHHRQGDDRIQNATLSYIEPYASSACEMVAEVLQYFGDELKLRSPEADAMYAGIVVDTNNFITRTGVRTFEAAAYLRKCGADITRVRKMFRDDLEDCKAKAEAIASAEIFEGVYAISKLESTGLRSPTVTAAQTANELLNVNGIKASFVMTDYNDQIYISARAIDEVNVQLIMERLGGGGHLNIAGAQLPDYTIDEAVKLLKDTMIEMQEEGDM